MADVRYLFVLLAALGALVPSCVELARPRPTCDGAPCPEADAGEGSVAVDAPFDLDAGRFGDLEQDALVSPDARDLVNGAPCGQRGQCSSGLCVDGVCCASECSGACMACNVPGKLGACALALPGRACGAPSCNASRLTPPGRCDGNGGCTPEVSVSCDGFTCASPAACRTTCTTSGDCVTPYLCIAGRCAAPLALGALCKGDSECASGSCAQGVCCGSPCVATCYSCALPGTLGTCTVVAAGQDPLDQCAPSAASNCGTDGTCDGAGGCRLHVAGSVCAASKCSGSALTPGRTCDGRGTCLTGAAATICDPYLCADTVSCRKKCMNSSQCVTGSLCQSGVCVSPKKANGEGCGGANDCASGFCTQGVCCNAICSGSCRSCNLAGSEGICTNVPAGQDPSNQCPAETAATCGRDGSCDGAGACRFHVAGSICSTASCNAGSTTPARTCDGRGVCQSVVGTSCGTYQCASAGACRTSCANTADCLAPSVCSGAACGGLKGQYWPNARDGTATAALTRTDPNVNFDWGSGSPSSNVGVDDFFVRWTGQLTPRYTEDYTFYVYVDDGARLWINDQLVVEWWSGGTGERTTTTAVALQAGKPASIKLEYYEGGGGAVVKLLWSSATQLKELVPTGRLIPAP